jgi:AcrR family transcriptional regulator
MDGTKPFRFIQVTGADHVNAAAPTAEPRPRVEGERELEILHATLDVLADVGYDRLTMDAVAARARASKATLYRRWTTKAALVIDAVQCQKGPAFAVDTGSLRGDLIATACDQGGLSDPGAVAVLASLMTAIHRDADFAQAWRRDFVQPKVAAARVIYERARDRGEIRADLDLDLVATALPGIVLHRIFVLGEAPCAAAVTEVIDQIILPACRPVPTPG